MHVMVRGHRSDGYLELSGDIEYAACWPECEEDQELHVLFSDGTLIRAYDSDFTIDAGTDDEFTVPIVRLSVERAGTSGGIIAHFDANPQVDSWNDSDSVDIDGGCLEWAMVGRIVRKED
jgi:hypothetical protein